MKNWKDGFRNWKKIESELEYSREMLRVYEKALLGYQSLDENGNFNQTHCIFHDITCASLDVTGPKGRERTDAGTNGTSPSGNEGDNL